MLLDACATYLTSIGAFPRRFFEPVKSDNDFHGYDLTSIPGL
jgi:hypothetical protein